MKNIKEKVVVKWLEKGKRSAAVGTVDPKGTACSKKEQAVDAQELV